VARDPIPDPIDDQPPACIFISFVDDEISDTAQAITYNNSQAPGFFAQTLHQPPAATLLPTKILQPPCCSPGLP
jgi:hypothetical protein